MTAKPWTAWDKDAVRDWNPPMPHTKPTLTIPFELTGRNDMDSDNRTGYYVGARTKKDETFSVYRCIQQQLGTKRYIAHPVLIYFYWHECENRGKRRDPDNIASANKQILDALRGPTYRVKTPNGGYKLIHEPAYIREDDLVHVLDLRNKFDPDPPINKRWVDIWIIEWLGD